MSKSVAVWRDATPLEQRAMLALTRCRFAPATVAKKFARSMGGALDHPWRTTSDGKPWPIPAITDAQAALLWKFCYHYRKQINSGSDVYIEALRRWVEHDWREPTETIKYPFCGKCLTIKRTDGMNGPCKGAAKLRAMENMTNLTPKEESAR